MTRALLLLLGSNAQDMMLFFGSNYQVILKHDNVVLHFLIFMIDLTN